MPVNKLIEDPSTYPRSGVSTTNVANLVAVLEAGMSFRGLILADEVTKTVIDGYHRKRAFVKVFGEDAKIKVELRRYENSTQMLAAATEANTSHGLGLQEIDKRRVTLRLADQGVDDDEIARVLHVPPARIAQIKLRVSTVVSVTGLPIRVEALKRPLFHLTGGTMTESQAWAHRSAPGTSYALLIRQLREALRCELIDESDGRIISALRGLAAEIDSYLANL
jgi:hypothetical protein